MRRADIAYLTCRLKYSSIVATLMYLRVYSQLRETRDNIMSDSEYENQMKLVSDY